MSHGWAKGMSSLNEPVLCCPLPYRVAPVFVQVVSPSLGWSPLSSFLVIWSPSGDARGPPVVFEAVNMPCPGPFHVSHMSTKWIMHAISSEALPLTATPNGLSKWAFIYVKRVKAKHSVILYIGVPRVLNDQCQARLYL